MSIDRAELIFTGLLEPDPETSADDPDGQAQAALGLLAETLSERGLDLEDLLRLRLFVADLGAQAAIESALEAHLGPERPAVSVVELPAGSLPAGVSARLDAVASPGARASRRLRAGSVRLGPWVFVGALAATEPRMLFAHMDELLREQGAELRDVVRVDSWLTFPMRDYGPLGQVRAALVAEAGLLPASAGVQIGRMGLAGQRLACEAIAYAPARGDGRDSPVSNEPVARATSRLADFYLDARTAGGYVFTSGEVPDGRGSVREQAAEVYERLDSHLAVHGASPADVVQQTVFVRGAADRDAVAGEARKFYGAGVSPPTTLLSVADLGFHPGCDVEIELVARAPRAMRSRARSERLRAKCPMMNR